MPTPAKSVKHADRHSGSQLGVVIGSAHPQAGQCLGDADDIAVCQSNNEACQRQPIFLRQLLALPEVQQANVASFRQRENKEIKLQTLQTLSSKLAVAS